MPSSGGDVLVRPETPADQAAIREINLQAFGRPAEADVVDRLRRSAEFIPELSLVAERDDVLLGHVLLSRVSVEGSEAPVELLGLGPVAVLPPYQRQGIGGHLIRAALARAAALGYAAVVLIGHPAYYPRFGFVPASRYGLRSTYDVPDDVFMALPLRPGGLDGVRGTVHFSPAFQGV